MTDLVERLRSKHIHFTEVKKCKEAAVAIEALTKANAEMREALAEAERFLDYFANGRHIFVGGGTPQSALAQVRAALARKP